MKSVALLACWFGRYPWYFPYYIHSCRHNPTIDFFIITDNKDIVISCPTNVKIIYKTLDEIRNAISLRMGFTVSLDYPYKLCDFRPAYGVIFPEIIKSYDFWGHIDIDVMYGRIRDFINDEILSEYDIINSRHDYVAGHFCLYRNNQNINNLFKESQDYRNIFSQSEYFNFDECSFLHSELQTEGSVFDYPGKSQNITWIIKKADEEGKLKAFFDFMIIEGTPGNIKWEKGKLIYNQQYEAMYYHLIKFKKLCEVPERTVYPLPDTIFFTSSAIIDQG